MVIWLFCHAGPPKENNRFTYQNTVLYCRKRTSRAAIAAKSVEET